MSHPTPRSIGAAVDRHAPRLLALPNVVGMSVANKIQDGVVREQLCVQVYVERRIPLEELPAEHLVHIDDVVTDVVEIGRIRPLTGPRPLHAARQRPVCGGLGIGPPGQFSPAGTIATVCTGRGGDKRRYVLSNNHVLTPGNKLKAQKVFQPAGSDGGATSDIVGTVANWVRIEYPFGPSLAWNQVDAAVARLDARQDPEWAVTGVGEVLGINPRPAVGTEVRFSGRTSGLVDGTVVGIKGCAVVDVHALNDFAYFDRQLIIKATVRSGDSGSLVVDRNRLAVGLLFAAGDDYAVINPIDEVERQLGISVTARGLPPFPLMPRPDLPPSFLDALTDIRTRFLNEVNDVFIVSAGEDGTGALTIDVQLGDKQYTGPRPDKQGEWPVRWLA